MCRDRRPIPPGRADRAGPDRYGAAVLVIDAANVVGSRPDGWWRDRPGAAAAFTARVVAAVASGRLTGPAVVVLEGAARRGSAEGVRDGVEVVHAAGSGDDAIVALVARASVAATVVTADRALGDRVRAAGAGVVGPRWLLDRLDEAGRPGPCDRRP